MTNDSPPLDISAPVILLIGKTGAGKSTLGNILLKTCEDDNPTFPVSDIFSSVTKKSGSASYQIEDESYNIVDTPGIFYAEETYEDIFEEIARTIQKCTHGIKAILFVFEARRFSIEQKNTLNGVKMFLGEEALQYIIPVFSHCNKKQTNDPEYFRKTCWNATIKAFVNSVGGRWAISPNPDDFPPNNVVHKKLLKELHEHIISIDGFYTNELLEKTRREQEENARIAREKEEEQKRKYEELIRKEGEARAREEFEKERADEEERKRKKNEEELASIKKELEDLKNNNNKKSDDPKNKNSCFWLETQVKLESGRIIQMSELQIGDRVLSNIRNGIAEFSDVYLIAHIGKLDHKVKFAKVSFTRPDGAKDQLRLTTTHYVFDENLSIIFAKNLRPGETKILVSDDDNKLVPVLVDDVKNEWHDKYISFYTRAGSVIADGVLCSCYDHCPPSQTLMDLVFLPVRWWTHIIPSTHREERLHPYVQFLETAYLSFISAMKKSKQLIRN